MMAQVSAFERAWGVTPAQFAGFIRIRLALDFNKNHSPKNGQFIEGQGGHSAPDVKTGRKDAVKSTDINLPDSSHISTLEDAEDYYNKHLRGVHRLTIHRKAGDFDVDVDMTNNADHAYTKDSTKALTKGQREGKREFDAERARLMGHILKTISHPSTILTNYGKDLFVARNVPGSTKGDVHVVVLKWNGKRYGFRSSHVWDTSRYRQQQGQLRGAKPRGQKN